MDQPPSFPTSPAPQSNSGAKIATGCGIGCLAAVLISGILVFLGVKSFQGKIDDLANKASSDPIVFEYPKVQVVEAEDVIKRFNNFREALSKSRPAEPLILSEDDINILISQHPDLEPLAGRCMIDIVENQIVSDVSIKPEELPFQVPFFSKALAGKYINGTAKFDLKIKEGEAEMYLLDFKFAQMSLPTEFLSQIKGENLLKDSNKEKDFRELIGKIEELKIENDQIHIIPAKVQEPAVVP